MMTKVCLVKAMVFPVVMYGCESWTIKEAERQRIDAFVIPQAQFGEFLQKETDGSPRLLEDHRELLTSQCK